MRQSYEKVTETGKKITEAVKIVTHNQLVLGALREHLTH